MAFIRDEELEKQMKEGSLQGRVGGAARITSLQPMQAVASQTPTGERTIGARAPLLADYLRANRESGMAQKAAGELETGAQALQTTQWKGTEKGPQGYSAQYPVASFTETANKAGAPVRESLIPSSAIPQATTATPATQAKTEQAAQPLQPSEPLGKVGTPIAESKIPSSAIPQPPSPILQFDEMVGRAPSTNARPTLTTPSTGTAGALQAYLQNQSKQTTGTVGYAEGTKPGDTSVVGTIGAPASKETGTGFVGFAEGTSAQKPGVTGVIGAGQGLTQAEKEAQGLRKPDVNAAQALLDAQRIQQEAAMLGSEAGRQAFLQEKARGQSYTQGESLLDAALMGALAGDRLQGLKGKYANLYQTIQGRQQAEQQDFDTLQAAMKKQEEGDLQSRLQQAKTRTAAERAARDSYAEQKRRVAAYNRLASYNNAMMRNFDEYRAGKKSKADYELFNENTRRFINEDQEIQQYQGEGWDKTDFSINNYRSEDDYIASQLKKAGF